MKVFFDTRPHSWDETKTEKCIFAVDDEERTALISGLHPRVAQLLAQLLNDAVGDLRNDPQMLGRKLVWWINDAVQVWNQTQETTDES